MVIVWLFLSFPSVLFAGHLLLFHRLFEAEAFAVHLEDFGMVSQAVKQSGRHAFALKSNYSEHFETTSVRLSQIGMTIGIPYSTVCPGTSACRA